jgi:hypothetical protein
MIGRSLADLMSEMGHKRTNQSAPVPTFVRYAPNSGQTGAQPDCPLSANRVRCTAANSISIRSPRRRNAQKERPPRGVLPKSDQVFCSGGCVSSGAVLRAAMKLRPIMPLSNINQLDGIGIISAAALASGSQRPQCCPQPVAPPRKGRRMVSNRRLARAPNARPIQSRIC